MDTSHWPQFSGDGGGGVVVNKQMESVQGGGGGSSSKINHNLMERKSRPQKDQALNCPRCNSTNTKFCYYNNYSLSQPRYFCKACRRYWTDGGSLRNVPVGGGSRKNKRSSSLSSSTSSSSAEKKINGSDQNPKMMMMSTHDQDLNLAIFPPNPIVHASSINLLGSFMAPPPGNGGGIFSGGGGGGGGGFGLNEQMKSPSLSFSLEGFESGEYGDLHSNNNNNNNNNHFHHHQDQDQTAVMFPIEDLKQSNNSNNNNNGGFWNGVLGGGGSW